MASTTQIVPKYSFPYVETHVNDYTQVTQTEEQVYSDPSCKYIFVFRSPKGIDNVFVRRRTATDFKKIYGDSNYNKYGQPLMMPLAMLESATSTGYCMRVMPENATYAHKVVNLHYLADTENRKFYIKLVGNVDTNKTVTTPGKLDAYAKTTIPETGLDAEGFTVKAFERLRSAGRGDYGKNYCIRASVNETYENQYGLKMYTYGIASKEGNYKQVATYVGGNTTTSKYTDNTFISDILDDTDVGIAPVDIRIDEDSLQDVYDAYIDFCAVMADEKLPNLIAGLVEPLKNASDKYTTAATKFKADYNLEPSDVLNKATDLVVPQKLIDLRIAYEEAKALNVQDDIDAAKRALDEAQQKYLDDVAKLQTLYDNWVSISDEKATMEADLKTIVNGDLPDFDQFDFIFGQNVGDTTKHPFIELVTSRTQTRTTTQLEPGSVTGDVDTSTLANVTDISVPIAEYCAGIVGNNNTYASSRSELSAYEEAVSIGADDYVVDSNNQVYLIYQLITQVNQADSDPENLVDVYTTKYLLVGTKKITVEDSKKEVLQNLVGSDEEIIDFGSTLGVTLDGGYDGYFAEPRTTQYLTTDSDGRNVMVEKKWTLAEEEAECFKNAFNGTYDRRILTAKRIEADAIFDANYAFDVKETMADLAILRNDCLLYLDTGIVPSYTKESVTALVNQYSVFNNYLISKNLQHYKVKEVTSGKRVTVTITYFLGQIHSNHYINNGFEIPLVKEYAQLTGHIRNSLEPTIEDFEGDLKQILYTNRFNYFETVGDDVYQRATQITSQMIESDLSEESNVTILSVIKRGVEDILNRRLYNFSDPEERKRLKNLVTTVYQPYVGSKVEDLGIEFKVSEYEAEHSIIHCYLAITFKGLDKKALFEIDINKRDTSTASAVMTE